MARKSIIEDIRKDQIIESAIGSIASVGYVKTTLDQIAETADISRGVITYYFKSKDQVISAVMKRILEEQRRIIMERVDGQDSPREMLREYIHASFDHMMADRTHYEAEVELWSNLEYKKEFNEKVYKSCTNILTEILEGGVASGQFRELDITNAAALIQGCIDGVMIQWVFNERSVDLEAIKALLTTIIFSSIEK